MAARIKPDPFHGGQIYCYDFAIYPEAHQPSGGFNCGASRLDNVNLVLTTFYVWRVDHLHTKAEAEKLRTFLLCVDRLGIQLPTEMAWEIFRRSESGQKSIPIQTHHSDPRAYPWSRAM